jgi:photosynthetic reaction center cytochrome c subunit
MKDPAVRTGIGLLIAIAVALLFTFTRLPVETVQGGFRGTAMDENFNPRHIEEQLPRNIIPATLPPIQSGPPAATVYKNVQVLGGLSVGAFTRLMASITTWVAPVQGCAYCHALNNMADDSLYTKVVARRMIQMTQHINGDWQTHVQQVGVTCYTCHRGNPVPGAEANAGKDATRVNQAVWYSNSGPSKFNGMLETQTGKNLATDAIGKTSLPYDPFTPFLEDSKNIRVQATEPLPDTDMSTIKQTDWTYALMIHFSQSLGVNCTYCHNSRAFGDWTQSTPQRATAWYGIRMVRDVNLTYLNSLQDVWPAYRLGAEGDSPKVNCTTCHQGVYKPLFGKSPLVGFPELSALGAALPKGQQQSQADVPQ